MAEIVVNCTKCGKENSPNAAVCIYCRTPLAHAAQPSAASGSASPSGVPEQPTSSPPHETSGASATAQEPTPSYVLKEHPRSLTQRGVVASLFDVTFTSLIGTKLVRVLYVLAMVWVGLTALFYIFLGFHTSPIAGLAVLFIVAPLISLILLGVTRLAFEVYIAIFQLVANTNELVAQGRRDRSV